MTVIEKVIGREILVTATRTDIAERVLLRQLKI